VLVSIEKKYSAEGSKSGFFHELGIRTPSNECHNSRNFLHKTKSSDYSNHIAANERQAGSEVRRRGDDR